MQIAQSRKLSLAMLIGCAIAAAIILIDVVGRMESMQPQGQTADAIAATSPGTKLKAIIRIDRKSAGREFSGSILEELGSNQFHATAKTLRVIMDHAPRLIMGSQADLHSGAVVEVSGTAVSSTIIDASQIVVLTGYVEVRR